MVRIHPSYVFNQVCSLKSTKWGLKLLTLGLLVALMPCADTWAAQKRIPRSRDNSSLKDYHGLGVEVSFGFLSAEKVHGHRSSRNAWTWSLGGVYGYAWAQLGETWYMPEIGVKYGVRQRIPSYSKPQLIIKEPSLYIPLSMNWLSMKPEWQEGSSTKFVVGIGYEVAVALSSYCFLEGEDSRNLLKDIPDLSRFSGSFFIHSKISTGWGSYLSLALKFPANIARLKNSGDWDWYPSNQSINKSHVEAFRIDTTYLVELGLGLDILPLFED
jgi:hypothetical protein